MPVAPIERAFEPMVISRQMAAEVNAATLYAHTRDRVNSSDVSITIQGGSVSPEGKWQPGSTIRVFENNSTLADLLPSHYQFCSVLVSYILGRRGFDPDENLPRQEFLMQTLDIWERMLTSLSFSVKSEKSKDAIIAAMELLKGTYTAEELLPSHFGLKKFMDYFDPTASLRLESNTTSTSGGN